MAEPLFDPIGTASGSFGWEPRASKRPRVRRGAECPECEGVKTEVQRTGRDTADRPIRLWGCMDCGVRFVVGSYVIRARTRADGDVGYAKWSEVDVQQRDETRERQRAWRGSKTVKGGWAQSRNVHIQGPFIERKATPDRAQENARMLELMEGRDA